MSPEPPAELQILMQLLGPDQGRMVFALNTMATSCAQLAQQVQQLQQQAPQAPAMATEMPPPPPTVNPFTGETVETREVTG